MKIVIDIPNENYQVILTKIMLDSNGCKITEIPKGHGRLIDADELLEKVYTIENGGIYGDCEVVDRYEIENAPTIIEADKEV